MSARESRPSKAEAAPEEFRGSEIQDTESGATTVVPTDRDDAGADPKTADEAHDKGRTVPTATSLPTYEELQIAGAMRVREEADFREALGESLSLGDLARLTINATTGLMLAQREDRKQLGREPFRPSVFLAASQAAILLLGRFEIRHVVPDGTQADDGLGLLAIYQDEGPLEGTYRRVDLGLLEELASELSPGHDKRWYAELERKLRTWAPRVSEMSDPDLVPMADCWYHYSTGEYLPFTSDRVTLSKFATRLPQTEPPVPEIVNADGTVWNAKDWFAETFVGVETLVLQIIGMCLRPAHDWRKMVYLTGKGLNGKGTLIELIRALVGVALVAMIPPSQFGGRFNVSQAIGKRVNLVDEDDVGAFIEAAAVLKQVISRDPVMMDRKHKDPIAVRLLMSIIVSINEVSQKFKDRTTAMDDRQVFVPMPGRFAGAAKNPAIKNDYVKRPEVREWFAYQALVALPKYWALEESEASLAAKDAAKADTDFTVAYWEEFGDRWERPFLPYDLLYAHYRAWRSKVNPGGKPEAQKVVTARLKELVDPEQWVVATNASGRDAELTLNQWLLTNEPVLAEFDYLPEVANWDYGTKYANGTYLPVPTEWMLKKEKARGFVRREVWVVYRADGRTPRALHVEAERNGSVPPPRASEGEIADVMTLIEIADRGEAMAAPSKELEPFSEEDRAANPGIKL